MVNAFCLYICELIMHTVCLNVDELIISIHPIFFLPSIPVLLAVKIEIKY